jgi:hypothetical protein
MPRPASETSALVADLTSRLARIIDAARAEGRSRALAEIQSLVGGGAPAKRGPGRPRGSRNQPKAATAKPKKRDGRRNSWSGMTPAARLARINAIRKGKGLPPRSE